MAPQTAAELGEETREIAMEIEREVSGVLIQESYITRNRFKVDYDEYLPPEVAEMARKSGFVFEKSYGTRAVFKRQDEPTMA